MFLRFLHISDIHFQIENYQSRRMRMSLLRKLEELKKENKFDFIILTGDLSHQGQMFSENQIQFLKEILQTLNLSKDKIYIVPGNHDINRIEERTSLIQEINNSDKPSELLDQFLENANYRDKLLSSFSSFSTFYYNLLEKEYPLDKLHFITETDNYNIVHLNTCLLANRSNEEGSLLIGKNKLFDCLSTLGFDNNKLTIAIGHHTLECMEQIDKKAILHLFDDYKIDLYFSGHVHKASYDIKSNSYNNLLNIVSSGVHSDDYALGGFVDVVIEDGVSKISQYIWNEEHEYWTLNNSLGRRMENGYINYQIPKFSNPKHPINSDINREVELKKELNELFIENERLFKQYGPFSITAQQKPNSDFSNIWKEKCKSDIIPNNDKILKILVDNKNLIPVEKLYVLEIYKNHVEGFKMNQLTRNKSSDVPVFPKEILSILD